jgi:DNA-directed RNA polymerase specialized sigma subunit
MGGKMKKRSTKRGHVWAHCLLLVRDNCVSAEQKALIIEILALQNISLAEFCVRKMYDAAGGKEKNYFSQEALEKIAVVSLISAIETFIPFVNEDFCRYVAEEIVGDILNLMYGKFHLPKSESWEDLISRKVEDEEAVEWERFLPASVQIQPSQMDGLEKANDDIQARKLIDSLPNSFMRRVMRLRFIEGLDRGEVVNLLKEKPKKVRESEKRALKILRVKINAWGGG